MSDLEKAIELRGKRHRGETYGCLDCYHNKPCADRTIIDAARRFASLASPETIEKAADAVEALPYDTLELRNWGEEGVADPYRIVAEAVLRSVEEGET